MMTHETYPGLWTCDYCNWAQSNSNPLYILGQAALCDSCFKFVTINKLIPSCHRYATKEAKQAEEIVPIIYNEGRYVEFD